MIVRVDGWATCPFQNVAAIGVFPQLVKPIVLRGRTQGPEQAAEKGLISGERPEKHTSGAKAHIDSIGFIPGINPRPTARMSFSAACEGPCSLRKRLKPSACFIPRGSAKPVDDCYKACWGV